MIIYCSECHRLRSKLLFWRTLAILFIATCFVIVALYP